MIRKLKSTYFHIDEITDVIAVNYQPIPAGSAQIDGEIFVNIELAVKRGRSNAAHELALYIAHGLDHLTGAEDTTSIERRQMRRRELRWLSKAAAEGLLAKIFNHPCTCRRFPSAPTRRLHV